jgi:hypothetical protein
MYLHSTIASRYDEPRAGALLLHVHSAVAEETWSRRQITKYIWNLIIMDQVCSTNSCSLRKLEQELLCLAPQALLCLAPKCPGAVRCLWFPRLAVPLCDLATIFMGKKMIPID